VSLTGIENVYIIVSNIVVITVRRYVITVYTVAPVCPSVASWRFTKTLKTMPYDGRGTLVFWRQRSLQNSNGVAPFPRIDIIGAVVIVWRLRGKIIRSVLCNIVSTIVLSAMLTHMNRPNRSVDWVLSHWAHFTVLRFIFVYACKCMYFLYDCILHECECVVIVTW